MNQEIRSLAWKQYFKYFAGWFVVAGLLLAVTIAAVVFKSIGKEEEAVRNNAEAPTERVYDEADVLTPEEEANLRAYIAEREQWGTLDIVIVTLNVPMGSSDYEWENNMMNFADDFYDAGAFGWNMPYGDGVCLVDNWYEDEDGSQKGSWLSTTGKMEDTIGWEEEDAVFDAMYDYIDSNPYKAYCAAVDRLADYGRYGYDGEQGVDVSWFCGAFIIPIIVALIYAGVNLSQAKAQDTTVPGTYVENGKMNVRSRTDQFLRKSVSSYRVSSSSSSGGGSSHRGGGSHGSHRSSSGRSHGGGGRRR